MELEAAIDSVMEAVTLTALKPLQQCKRSLVEMMCSQHHPQSMASRFASLFHCSFLTAFIVVVAPLCCVYLHSCLS